MKDRKETGSGDFVVDLDKIPNGNKKPIELCERMKKQNQYRFRPNHPLG